MLSVRAQILPESRSVPPAVADAVDNTPATVNNFLHSIFNQVHVYFNRKLVSPPKNAHAYKAFIEILLNYSSDVKKSHLSTSLWYDDTPGKLNEIATTANAGVVKYKEFTADRK